MLVSFRFKQFTDDMQEVDRLRTVKHNFILGIIIRRFKTVLESTHHIKGRHCRWIYGSL